MFLFPHFSFAKRVPSRPPRATFRRVFYKPARVEIECSQSHTRAAKLGAMEPKMAEKQANTKKKAGGKPAFF
jgi:hypothetical protein